MSQIESCDVLRFHVVLTCWKFVKQERFYNAPTHNKSRASVVDEIVRFSAEAIGNSNLSAIESGFDDRKTDLLTRVSFAVIPNMISFLCFR